MANKRHSQSDTADITTDGAGAGSVAITFENPFDHADYSIVVTPQEADATGVFHFTSKTASGCTITVTGSAVVSGTLTVGYVANQNYF